MPTLPRLLAPKGYLSFEAGKWWGGSYKRGGFTHGMTHGDPSRGGRHGDAGLAIGRQGIRPMTLFIELATARKAPFFVWYAPMMPHQPHNPPERLLAHYRGKAPTEQVAKYWAMCEWFDETCGELLDFLDAKKLADNTLVVFLADNGWIQDPQADRYAPRSKQSPYDGGLRTPILVRWPGKVAARTCDTPVSAIDIAPTVLKAAGVDRPAGLEGVNLLDEQGRLRPSARLRRDLHPQRRGPPRPGLEPAPSLDRRWRLEADRPRILAMSRKAASSSSTSRTTRARPATSPPNSTRRWPSCCRSSTPTGW